MNEFDLIEKYFTPLAGPEGFGLKDDAAHFSAPAGIDVILTKDAMVEGVHFPNGQYGALVAERLLRVNLSDLAAKAAKPRGYLLSIAWPEHLSTNLIGDFAKGLKDAQSKFDVKLWGGDTVRTTGPLVVSATLIGTCPEGLSTKRFGAKAGDDIWVTGQIGKGFIGLEAAESSNAKQKYIDFFYRPEPRLSLHKILRTWASSAIDISDGFAADLGQLSRASQVTVDVDIQNLLWPSVTKQRTLDLLKTYLSHGDDYEILFTAHPDYRSSIEKAAKELDFPVSKVGKCGAGKGVTVRDGDDILDFESRGYSHFN